MLQLIKDFAKGIWKENPTFVLVLGMCPTLAVTSNAINGASMGLATALFLCAAILQSLLSAELCRIKFVFRSISW